MALAGGETGSEEVGHGAFPRPFRNGVIPRAECLRLLAGQTVGRLGFVVHGRPMVLPVNYVLVGDLIVFRTGEGWLAESLRDAVVPTWLPRAGNRYVCIKPRLISGRRLPAASDS